VQPTEPESEDSWDDRLRPVLTDDWQSAEHIAARLHAKPFTVLARLKDMMRRNLVERRIVKKMTAVPPGKGRVGRPIQEAQFRRLQLGQRPQGPS
jgi:predicted ArsR family transcriptional regulator